jgi:two-component sensor histidine kinase
MRGWSLRSRLVLLLIIANLPALALAGLATYRVEEIGRAQRAEALVQRATEAGARVQTKLAAMTDLLDGLAATPDVTSGGGACPAILSGALAGRNDYASILVAGADGKLLCQAGDPTAKIDPSTLAHVAAGDEDAMQGLLPSAKRSDTGELFYKARPAKAPDGSGRALATTLRNVALRNLLSPGIIDQQPPALILATADGHVAARTGVAELRLPPGTLTAAARSGQLQGRVRPAGGESYFYSVTAVPHSILFAIAAAPTAVVGGIDWFLLAARFGIPLIMLGIAVLIVYLGLDRLVLRWMREFSGVSAAFAEGDFSPRLQHVEKAPREVADVGRSFNAMAERLDQDAQALAAAVEGKNRLLRELHHRVKNNFQMIASLLAMQRREMPGAMRNLLRVPEDRVLAMAAAYKASYATGEIGQVDLVELMRDVASQIRQSFGLAAPLVQVGRNGPPVTIDLDRAVPLGLLASEILTSALERGEGAVGPLRIDVLDRAGPSDSEALVEIAISGTGVGAGPPLSGLVARLITAYLAQLDASLERDGDKMAIVFALKPATPTSSRIELGIA